MLALRVLLPRMLPLHMQHASLPLPLSNVTVTAHRAAARALLAHRIFAS